MGGLSDEGTGYNDTDTSESAAQTPRVLLREQIYQILFDAGPQGLADFELEQRTDYRFATQRRSDLTRQKRLRDTGDRRINPEYERKQIVWSAFDANGDVICAKPPASKRGKGKSKGK